VLIILILTKLYMYISDLIKLLQLKLEKYWDAVVQVKEENRFESKTFQIETIVHDWENGLNIYLRK